MSAAMTLGNMAKAFNRPVVYLRGLQSRFELPVFKGAGYSTQYLVFLKGVVFLRTLGISEDTIRELWTIEKKLLQLLHADSTDSKTWFLDACGQTAHRKRRLLLTNYDLGREVGSRILQLRLDFNEKSPELFTGIEMGEDEIRVLEEYLHLCGRISADVKAEIPLLKEATKWAKRRF